MSKVFDLSSYLEEKPSTIKLGDEEFTISDGFNDLLKIDALSNRKDEMETTDFIREFLSISLGEEASKKLIEKNYPTKVYMKIMDCIQQTYSESDDGSKESASNTELV